MTAQEFISMAVNAVQNRLDEVERSSESSTIDGLQNARNEGMKEMLHEVYQQLLDTNRKAVAARLRDSWDTMNPDSSD